MEFPDVTSEQLVAILLGFLGTLFGGGAVFFRWVIRRLLSEKKTDDDGRTTRPAGLLTRLVDKHTEFIDTVEAQGEKSLLIQDKSLRIQQQQTAALEQQTKVLDSIHDSQSQLIVLSTNAPLARTNAALTHLADALYVASPEDKKVQVKPHTDALKELLRPRDEVR